MAGIAFPSYAYNSAGQAPQIVASQAAFTALGGPGTWAFSPYAVPPSNVPIDPGFTATDTRLQQMLVELRVANLQLQAGLNLADDPQTQLRPEVVANDSGLTT